MAMEAPKSTLFGKSADHNLNVDPAAAIWMWSDEEQDILPRAKYLIDGFDNFRQGVNMPLQTVPVLSVAQAPGASRIFTRKCPMATLTAGRVARH